MLTDPEFIKKLEMLSLLTRKVLGGDLKADRKTTKKGSGLTFADYAEYNFGDDFRNIDWNVYARFENLFIKLFELEEDIRIFLLIDLSRSMLNKLDYCKQLAAALGYIALNNHDHLTVYSMADSLETILAPSHGRGKIFPMLEALEQAKVFGHDTDFANCFKTFQLRHKRPGVCVLISDFFVSKGYKTALDYLLWSRNDVFAIQVLDPAEMKCDWRGDIELECIETKASRKITVGPVEAARFARAIKDWNQQLKHECAKKGVGLVQTTLEAPFEDIIQNILRRGGLVA